MLLELLQLISRWKGCPRSDVKRWFYHLITTGNTLPSFTEKASFVLLSQQVPAHHSHWKRKQIQSSLQCCKLQLAPGVTTSRVRLWSSTATS